MNKGCAVCNETKLKLVLKLSWPLYRCQNCGLVQAFPLPSKNEVKKLYQGDYYKNYSFYNSQIPAHRAYFQKKIAQIKKYRSSGKLLDVGCAVGILLDEAKKQGFTPEGVDVSDYAVNQCLKLDLKAFVGDITVINKKNYYDIITAFEIVEHEYDPVKALKTMALLLKPGGLLVITVPNTETLTNKLMGKYWFGWRNKEHLYHFNQKSLFLLLEKAGFSKIKIEEDSARPYLFTYYLERVNFYLFRSRFFDKIISSIKKIPLVTNLTINFNSWGNLIAFALKN